MRYGISVFLGLVEAEIVGYDDCARFLIECPCCHDAVFKVVRGEKHYLSHYREVPAEDAQRCELRVSSITKAQVEAAQAEARGQALAIFVARFSECVQRALPAPAPFVAMEARPRWRALARDLHAHMRSATPDEHEGTWREVREAYQWGLAIKPSMVWREESLTHARGMLAHALAPGSGRQFLRLFSAAAAAVFQSLGAFRQPPSWPTELYATVRGTARALAMAPELELKRAVHRAQRVRDPLLEAPPESQNVMERIAHLLIRECYVVLYLVPYEDILRETIGRTERPRRADLRGPKA